MTRPYRRRYQWTRDDLPGCLFWVLIGAAIGLIAIWEGAPWN